MSWRRGLVVGAAVLTLLPVATVNAGSPPIGAGISGNSGMAHVSDRVLPNGLVVSTFKSNDGTIKTIGRPGMSVDVAVDGASTDSHGNPHLNVQFSFSSQAANASKNQPASERNTMTAVETLIALGEDPAVAERDFGDFDAAPAALPTAKLASFSVFSPPSNAPVTLASPSRTTPWDTQCADFSYASGKVTGRGCSTIYWASAVGSDYYFESKYKITGSSNDTSLFPVRLRGLGWKLTWNDSHNSVYDWDPHTTVYGTSSCGTVTFSAVFLQLSLALCQDKESPWSVTSTSSGALWSGVEQNTDVVGAGGLQDNENPPLATSVAHYSTLYVSY